MLETCALSCAARSGIGLGGGANASWDLLDGAGQLVVPVEHLHVAGHVRRGNAHHAAAVVDESDGRRGRSEDPAPRAPETHEGARADRGERSASGYSSLRPLGVQHISEDDLRSCPRERGLGVTHRYGNWC